MFLVPIAAAITLRMHEDHPVTQILEGSFINFNGTAGVWRKESIIDAGGWSDDTLTEDLDLSYRAQLRGWKFKYLEDFDSPAELPIAMGAAPAELKTRRCGCVRSFGSTTQRWRARGPRRTQCGTSQVEISADKSLMPRR